MDAASHATPRNWRAFTDAVAAALGVNVWVSLVLVPGLFVGAFKTSTAAALLAAMPLVPLAIGLVRRSQHWLLLVYPATLLAPIAYAPRIVANNIHGPFTFTLVCLGVLAYLFGVSFFSAFHDPPPPERTRQLAGGLAGSAATPARWQRRFRLYAVLTVLSAVFPMALLYAINFDSENRAFLYKLYPGRVGAMTTLLNLGLFALWMLIYFGYFVGILKVHRTGDKGLVAQLARLRQQARRGTPRPIFYVCVVAALVFMLLLVVLRHRT